MSHHPTIAIVGSGPIGSAYARVLVEQLPDAHVVMFEAGPQLTDRSRARASATSPTPTRRSAPARCRRARRPVRCASRSASRPGVVVEGMFTARQGTHLLDFGGEGSAHAPTFPAAAAATNVGGQGAHWTCATPSPAFSEKIPFIPDDEWDDLLEVGQGPAARAERGLRRLRGRRGRSARCSRRSSPASCPRATARARCRSRATRSRTARCGGPAPTSCSGRSSTPRRRSASASSCATCARPPRRGRGRPRDRRHGRGPAHARDLVRAGRPRGRGRRRVPLAAAAVGLRHPSRGARPLPHRAPRRDLDRRAGRRARSAASPRRRTWRPRSRAAR